MALRDLYAKYGEMLIRFELLQGEINTVKKQIFDERTEVDEADDAFIARPITKE